MAVSLLVVTPHPSFGELIRQSLEETGSYVVRVVDARADALTAARQDSFGMAFLDLDLGEAFVSETGRALRDINPETSLVVICGDEKPPLLDEIRPWALLRKPFYLPELLHMLEEPPGQPESAAAFESKPDFLKQEVSWLEDVNRAAQHLTRLTLESSAQAALITRQSALWAYAGQLSQEAANEIAAAIARYWDTQKESDLLRFVRLESTKAEHMLYATRLAPGVIMALTFDAETPFSTIRTQANRLAQSLSITDEPSSPAATGLFSDFTPASPGQTDKNKGTLIGDEEDELEFPSISAILYDVPPPTPDPIAETVASYHQQFDRAPKDTTNENTEIEYPSSVVETRPSTPAPRRRGFSREASPAIPLNEMAGVSQTAVVQTTHTTQTTDVEKPVSVTEDLDATMPSKARRPVTPVRPPAPGELDETKPSAVTETARGVVLEPVSAGLYNLTYACLLVPRFSAHYLAGDLADDLSKWIPQICIAFGWRLEFLAVRPEYLQWVVNVSPSTSPGYLMRIMRQQTSERIFANFTRLKQENPSGDFWAPGYLIMGGDQPHPPQLVKEYINQTRQRQGGSRPRPQH